jgi:uncharacterized protein (TIGR02996 family)
MTKHGDALLQEILDDPAADPPRLVYADHLEQEGELARANFIRDQIRRTTLPTWDAKAVTLELQERAALDKHAIKWRSKLPPLDGITWGGFSRGFVGSVGVTGLAALNQLDEVRRASPVGSLTMRWPSGAKLPKLPAIQGIEELTLTGTVMGPDALKWLASCPLLSTLKTLALIDSSLRTGMPHLIKSTHCCASCRSLRIPLHRSRQHRCREAGGRDDAAGARRARSLRRYRRRAAIAAGVSYATPPVTSKSILELAAWPVFARIHTLDLSGAKLGSQGLLMLLATPNSKALKKLAIRGIKDGDWDMDDSLGAFKSGPAGTLEELDISDNDLDPEAAHYLAEAKALRELKVLRLANVKSTSFDRLGKASWMRSVRVLACNDQPLPHLLPRAEQLHTLEIAPSSTPLSRIAQLIAANPPPSLLVLDLSKARVDDAGLEAIAALDLPKLVSISLPHVRGAVSNAAVEHLATSKLGQQLVSFDCGIGDFDRLPPIKNYLARDEL